MAYWFMVGLFLFGVSVLVPVSLTDESNLRSLPSRRLTAA
jgi:hypothetical protein